MDVKVGDRDQWSNINIALLGLARAGKDTVADYISLHYDFSKHAFSSGVYSVRNFVYGRPASDKKDRSVLQGIGEALRGYDPDIWINYTLRNIEILRSLNVVTNAIITDCRLPSEYDRLKDEGYSFIRVNSPEAARRKRMEDEGDIFRDDDLTHETEQYVEKFEADYEIYNGGKITDTYQQIDYVMSEIIARTNPAT